MTCSLCNGSRWLGDNQSLGRCVCVTPEAMWALDEALDGHVNRMVALCDEAGVEDDVALLAHLEALNENGGQIAALARLPGNLLAAELEDAEAGDMAILVGALMDRGGLLERDVVRDLLEEALVSLGLPAVPSGALDNPALESLANYIMP